MYIKHAQNLSTGIPYTQTGYIYNSNTAVYGPPAYPPVFPLLLAPFVKLFGVNLLVLKIPGIICFLAFLYILNNKILTIGFPELLRIFIVGVTGFALVFFFQSESILSDLPFLLFSAWALLRINVCFSEKELPVGNWKNDTLTGFLIYLSYGTRSVGFLLIPIMILLYIIRKRKQTRTLLIVLLTSTSLMFMQNLVITGTGSYFDQFPDNPAYLFSTIATMLWNYFNLFIGLVPFQNKIIQYVIYLIQVECFVLGFLVRVKKGVTSYDLFFLFYGLSLLVWPSFQGYRFLLPVIPFYFLYIAEGANHISINLTQSTKIHASIIGALIVIVCLSYFNVYKNVFPRPVTAMEEPSTRDLFAYVIKETNTEDVIVFFKPRVLALFTGRNSVAISVPGTKLNALSQMNQFAVDWVIVRKTVDYEFQKELSILVSQKPDQFIPVYENDEFQMYRFINTLPSE